MVLGRSESIKKYISPCVTCKKIQGQPLVLRPILLLFIDQICMNKVFKQQQTAEQTINREILLVRYSSNICTK